MCSQACICCWDGVIDCCSGTAVSLQNSGTRRQQTSTAVLDTTDPTLRNYGSSAVARGKNTAENPQLGRLRPAVTSTKMRV